MLLFNTFDDSETRKNPEETEEKVQTFDENETEIGELSPTAVNRQ